NIHRVDQEAGDVLRRHHAPQCRPAHQCLASPKCVCDSFQNRVWYEDLSGSGMLPPSRSGDTLNERMVIMFCALEGAAHVMRIWGTGRVFEFGMPESFPRRNV
ncbi:hypothetical protein BD309DRAFT_1027685, partial [Dichomitus squalens]